jgi:Zn-dependent protease with chaperone function
MMTMNATAIRRGLQGVLPLAALAAFLSLSSLAHACPKGGVDAYALLRAVESGENLSRYQMNDVSARDVRAYLRVIDNLKQIARIEVRPLVCPGGPNAMVAFESPAPVFVTTGLLEITGDDESMIAAVIGHELGHLIGKHNQAKAHSVQRAIAAGRAQGAEVYETTRNQEEARQTAQVYAIAVLQSYSRDREQEADRIGIELLSEAGYDPDAAVKLADVMRERQGDMPTQWFDSHPAWGDRLKALEPVVQQEHFHIDAKQQVKDRQWRALMASTRQWVGLFPKDGRGWYYRGKVMELLKQAGSVEAFENAVTYRPELKEAWLHLCIGLYQEGHRGESLQCAMKLDHEARQDYQDATFKGPIHVGGDPTRHSSLWVGQDENGNSVIASDPTGLQSKGLPVKKMPPPWKAIRVQKAGAAK